MGSRGRDFDADLLARSGTDEVVVLPTAAAYEHPERVGERAEAYFGELGAKVRALPVLHRSEAEDPAMAKVVRAAKFVYLADGSPLHLRSVLKESALFEALLAAYQRWRRGGGVRRGRHVAVRPDGRPTRRRVHRRPRCGEEPGRVPVPRDRGRPTCASVRSTCCRATRCSPVSTRRPRW